MAAATTLRGRIQRLVLNDSGPSLAAGAIERIRSYAGAPAAFATVSELEPYFRTIYKPYVWPSDARWRRLTATSVRRRGPRTVVVVEIAGCGHAPALNTPGQFALVERFLAGQSEAGTSPPQPG